MKKKELSRYKLRIELKKLCEENNVMKSICKKCEKEEGNKHSYYLQKANIALIKENNFEIEKLIEKINSRLKYDKCKYITAYYLTKI